MVRQIRRNADRDLVPIVRNYAQNRTLRERAEKAELEYKKSLMEMLSAQGYEIEGGHRVIDLPEPIPLGKRTMKGIMRQRRAPQSLVEDRAEAFLRQRGLWDACTTQVTVLNEEAILALNFTGTISDVELAALYDTRETFAFYPVYED